MTFTQHKMLDELRAHYRHASRHWSDRGRFAAWCNLSKFVDTIRRSELTLPQRAL
jgi:hypothetical protein